MTEQEGVQAWSLRRHELAARNSTSRSTLLDLSTRLNLQFLERISNGALVEAALHFPPHPSGVSIYGMEFPFNEMAFPGPGGYHMSSDGCNVTQGQRTLDVLVVLFGIICDYLVN